MKKLLKLTLTLLILNTLYLIPSTAQVGINNDNSEPDASAMLDVKSDSKGMLVPRMSSSQRTMISSPATGLLVFDTDTESFWFKDSNVWVELVSGNVSKLADADGDTNIVLDDGNDKDTISFNIAGTEYFAMKQGRMEFLNTGRSVLLGFEAGLNDDFTDNRNVALGEAALRDATTGRWNAALGYATLRENVVGELNVAAGFSALTKVTTSENTAIGGYALTQNIIGTQNTALGTNAGRNNRGSGNLFLGYNAGRDEIGDNKLYIENSDDAAPLIYGEFDNDILRINGDLEVTGNFPQTDRIVSPNGNWQAIANNNKISISEGFLERFAFSGNTMNLNTGTTADFGNTQRIQFTDGSNNNQISNVFPSVITIPAPTNADYLMQFKVRNDIPLILKGNGSVEINEAYTLPTTDGTADQILTTDGSGNVDWIDLSTSMIQDADGDTKIQVEESADEDVIRFDIANTEILRLSKNSNGITLVELPSSGINSTLYGENAGASLSTGQSNTFIGKNTGQNTTTGDFNTFIGREVGNNNVDGMGNTFVGSSAGRYNIAGINNTYIGRGAGRDANGNFNVFIGQGAGASETGNSKLYIDAENTSSPLIYGEFDSNLVRINGGGTGDGYYPFIVKNNGNPSNARANGIRVEAGQNSNNSGSRFLACITPDGDEIGSIRQNGNSTVNFDTNSDIRLKTNIQPTQFSLSDLLQIEVKDYDFKSELGRTRTGFIAQQLYEHYPEAVTVGGEDEKTDPWGVDYGKLTPLLVKAIQEQQATIEMQQASIEAQQAEINQLKAQNARIQQLEQQMAQLLSQSNEDNDATANTSEEK